MMIRATFCLLSLLSCVMTTYPKKNPLPTQHAKMKLLVAVPSDQFEYTAEITQTLQKDLSFSGQFDVSVQSMDDLSTQKDIQALGKKGFPLVLFIALQPDDTHIEWRLYNAIVGSMITGKKCKKYGTIPRGWAHTIANMVWPELTAQPGFFTSKIAYCKQIERPGKHDYKHICIADFDGSHEQVLVHDPTVNVGPRFNKGAKRCLVFYSQFTNQNVELKVASMDKKHKSVSSFSGVNMLPAFSEDGKKGAYCATKGDGTSQIYYFEQGQMIQITDNKGNNISPTIADNGNKVYFCSDISGRPSIYCYHRDSGELERITFDAPCMSPSYDAVHDRLAYCKKIDGIYQVCTYDCGTKKHEQVTRGSGYKSECCWSPCGNYILYAVELPKRSYLETYHVLTKTQHQLATVGNCSYPAWSPCYRELPVVA